MGKPGVWIRQEESFVSLLQCTLEVVKHSLQSLFLFGDDLFALFWTACLVCIRYDAFSVGIESMALSVLVKCPTPGFHPPLLVFFKTENTHYSQIAQS